VKDDRVYLVHIRECIRRIEQYVVGGQAAFLSDPKTQDAVARNLQVLAESSTRLSATLLAQHPGIEWRAIRGFRNVLVHDYLGIDLERVWQIVERDLPPLKVAIGRMLETVGDGGGPSSQA
jgi:uncharacterized protein with HEPN domain